MSQLPADIAISLIFIAGIAQFRSPRSARRGNLTAAFAVLCAMAMVLMRHPPVSVLPLMPAAATGISAGWLLAIRINMIQIPAMVAFQHGMGGIAAFLVSFVELTRATGEGLRAVNETSALLGLTIGAATFSGSMVAGGKLANRIRQMPIVLARHNFILGGLAVAAAVLMAAAGAASGPVWAKTLAVILIVVSIGLGTVFSIRIGGADMPVLISFLNATAGLAAALCGVAIGNRLLIVCGAVVAASGSVLTHVMCRAMNRGLASIFAGKWHQPQVQVEEAQPPSPEPSGAAEANEETAAEAATRTEAADPLARSLGIIRSAQLVIIIPGYGMALADAQQEVSLLADKLAGMGKEVIFAVHPVAGRMPGHMHVLLAEAEVDYGLIHELQEVNPRFAQSDLALIVGACDVVNPAAIQRTDTPISGMPILLAHEARNIIVCNLDERPGYSGVENPLYQDPRTVMLLGDAKETLERLLQGLDTPA